MNRKSPPQNNPDRPPQGAASFLTDWHAQLMSRRRFLAGLAGGSVASLFPMTVLNAIEASSEQDPWPIIDAVQQHLFPTEETSPGAHEINALGYLRFVVTDASLKQEDRDFVTQGAGWLEGMSQQLEKAAFSSLDETRRERVLRQVAASAAGENWLSTLLLYLCEALLTDPVYGGNTDQVGWRWLQHRPGFPRPPLDKTFPRLLS